MASREDQLRALLAQIEEKEKRARKRAWIYVAIPLLVGVALLAFSVAGFLKLQKTNQALDAQISEKQKLLDDVNRRLERVEKEYSGDPKFERGAFDDSRKQQILDSVAHDANRRRALEIAFDLQQRRIEFKLGGKSPAEGFDTSGYVAYTLSQVGVIDNPETFYSGKLRNCFAKSADYGKKELPGMQAGDLIFYEPTTPVFYLDQQYCLGMVPKGIYVMETSTLEGLTFTTMAKVDYTKKTGCR